MTQLNELYQDHINGLLADYRILLEKYDFDFLIIASGEIQYAYLDDRDYPFCPNPQFKAVLPLCNHPGSYISLPRSGKPTLLYFQAEDYWHPVPKAPEGYWLEHFNIEIVRTAKEAYANFPKDLTKTALLGELNPALSQLGFAEHNPEALVNELHWRRAYKSPYEAACIKEANVIAVEAHNAAKDIFYDGGSELDAHYAYLKTAGICEAELPYTNIIGFNEHAAILHYTQMQNDRLSEQQRRSFLIDAGVYFNGYASDITRTYAYKDGEFAGLVAAFDELELAIIKDITVGESYIDLHRRAHFKIAAILQQFDFVKMSPESMVETGISSTFFPHGLGHFLGLQVHDIGGRQSNETGGTLLPPEPHNYLRNTRNIEVGQVFTIEPGLYFIDLLLEKQRGGPHDAVFNWDKINMFKPFGGIRIEDNVYISTQGAVNLTREAFAMRA